MINPQTTFQKIEHESGFIHLHSEDATSTGFSAVFGLRTPSFDDSGLAHACEHLVFRRSLKYPNPATLFQLSNLLGIKINASTLSNITLFHIESTNQEHFLLALDYLSSGLWQTEYSEQDLHEEVFHFGSTKQGVIFRELSGFEQLAENQHYRDWSAIIRGDHSPDRINHSGGFSDTLAHIKLDNIKAYFSNYYQPANTILLTTGDISQETISKCVLANISVENLKQHRSVRHIIRPIEPDYLHENHSDNSVFSWWLPQDCFAFLHANEELLIQLANEHSCTLLALISELNSTNQFAFRIQANTTQIPPFQNALLAWIAKAEFHSEPIYLQDNYLPKRKYSPTIRQLIISYIELNNSQQAAEITTHEQLISLLSQLPYMSSRSSLLIADEEMKSPSYQHSKLPIDAITLAWEDDILPEIQRLRSKPEVAAPPIKPFALPTFITDLYEKALLNSTTDCWNVIENKQHWLAVRKLSKQEYESAHNTARLISVAPPIIKSRIKGFCYSSQCQYDPEAQTLVAYKVFIKK
ncbi:insulinase family protein [Paraneptunicella aestuarii]|uniref:insulinase family protein n=1 Tax=Paraneptunicella aestuarii TaxID=2831148 RepID=UPI001E4DCED3|nr:insulinase family protein [Paraneptunicella aestuarii]UAA39154.1 insulinase family protein [Paraneptunicella aestuarii]